tara:strand:- start:5677 stop:5931 length:255 start_codon:yes stop_codon:yes gene_type:complete
MAHLQKLVNAGFDEFGLLGEQFGQLVNNIVDRVCSVAAGQDFAGCVVQLDDAFGIHQYMGLLGFFPPEHEDRGDAESGPAVVIV